MMVKFDFGFLLPGSAFLLAVSALKSPASCQSMPRLAADSKLTASFGKCQCTGNQGRERFWSTTTKNRVRIMMGKHRFWSCPPQAIPWGNLRVYLLKISLITLLVPILVAQRLSSYPLSYSNLTPLSQSSSPLEVVICCPRKSVASLNYAMLPCVVLMIQQSRLQKNEDNFGFDNRMDPLTVRRYGWCLLAGSVLQQQQHVLPHVPQLSTLVSDYSIPGFNFKVPPNASSAIQIITGPAFANPPSKSKSTL